MNDFSPDRSFDRVVSIEMFEHMVNWRRLLGRIRSWLKPEGRLFVHVFSHARAPYRFDVRNKADWIAQHFFSGGIMPSHDLMRVCTNDFRVERDWRWSGHPLRAHGARLACTLRQQSRRDRCRPARDVWGRCDMFGAKGGGCSSSRRPASSGITVAPNGASAIIVSHRSTPRDDALHGLAATTVAASKPPRRTVNGLRRRGRRRAWSSVGFGPGDAP